MRRGRLFWGGVLILFGLLLLLDNLGYLQPLGINVWNLLWPAFLILIGLSILWGTVFRRGSEGAETASVPLEGAEEAAITFHHGAGRLHVKGGAEPGELLSGSFVGGVGVDSRKRGGVLEVDLKVPSEGMWIFPWTWFNSQGFNWQVDLTTATPLALTVKSGASDTYLDLSDLMVKDLKIETGASSTEVLLPRAAGYTRGYRQRRSVCNHARPGKRGSQHQSQWWSLGDYSELKSLSPERKPLPVSRFRIRPPIKLKLMSIWGWDP